MGIKSSAAMSSVLVELWVLILWFLEVLIGMLSPRDMQPPEWTHILGCIAWEPSTYHLGLGMESARRIRGISMDPLKYRIICLNFFQASWSGPFTQVVRKATAVEISGLAHFVRKRHFGTKLWNIVACLCVRGSAWSSTLNKCSAAGVCSRFGWIVVWKQFHDLRHIGNHSYFDLTRDSEVHGHAKILVDLAARDWHCTWAIIKKTLVGAL